MNGIRGEDGGASVETALVLPVIVTILFAIIQFGLAFYEWQGLQAAAREGARLAAYSGAPPWLEIRSRVEESAVPVQGGMLKVGVRVGTVLDPLDQAEPYDENRADASFVCDGTVTEFQLQVRYEDDYPLQAIFFTASVPMSAAAVFRCENAP